MIVVLLLINIITYGRTARTLRALRERSLGAWGVLPALGAKAEPNEGASSQFAMLELLALPQGRCFHRGCSVTGALRDTGQESSRQRQTASLARGSAGSWGNTNRVASNRVVSKGPLYPSKARSITCLLLDTTPFICL